MSSHVLSSSEAHTIDLVALRRFHWNASMDPSRDHEMRTWHRDQVRWITLRMSAHGGRHTTTEFLAVVELLATDAQEQIHKEMETICAGDWEKQCKLAREAISAKLGH